MIPVISPTKKAFIATLVGHPAAEQYVRRAFNPDRLSQLNDELMKAGSNVSKEDLLTARDDQGQLMIFTSGFWHNFNAVIKHLEQIGDRLEVADCIRILDAPNKTLLQYAENEHALTKLISEKVFAGRPRDAEDLWYAIETMNARRSAFPDGFTPLKRRIVHAMGQMLREDQLEKAGINLTHIPRAFSSSSYLFDNIVRTLEAKGDRLTKADIMYPDTDGDTMFYRRETWNHFETITNHLAKYGERFEVDDFIYQRPYKQSMLTQASEHDALFRVFNPKLWAGRVEDMVKLWAHVKPAQRPKLEKVQSFEEYVAEAEDLTYGLKLADHVSKARMMEPLDVKDGYKVIPLGLRSTWRDIYEIKAKLEAQGQSLTIDDLRQKSGIHGSTCMLIGAKLGYLDVIFDVVKQAEKQGLAPLTFEDLLHRNKNGSSLLEVMSEKKKLAELFHPSLWVGRAAEMQKLWGAVPIEGRSQVKFDDVLSQTIQETNRRFAQKLGTLKVKKKP
jgi:hypothetical protein